MLRLVGSVTFMALLMVGCGGSGGGSNSGPPPPLTYSVGGTVTGLGGTDLVLNSDFGGDLPISASGSFAFSTRLPAGSKFNVSVKTQPTSSPAQNCQVANGTGTIAAANVTNVDVTCTSGSYTIHGTVSGVQGSGLVIQIFEPGSRGHPGHNVGPPLQINSDGPFTIVEGPPTVSNVLLAEISQRPASPYQLCLVRNAANPAASVTSIRVGCSQFAYVTNTGDNTVSVYTVDPATGALAAVGTPVQTGMSPHAICETQDRAFVFVANEGSNDISAFAIDFVSGALTPVPGSPFPAGTDPSALACPGGLLYVANAGTDTVSVYSVDGAGALTPNSQGALATGQGPSSILQLGPELLYVANHGGSNDISAFKITCCGPVSGSPFPAGGNPRSLAAASSFLYSADPDATSPSISGFSIDITTGVLSPLSGSPFPVPVSHDIATDNAQHLYVTSGDNVLGYGVDATTGALTPLAGFPVFAGANAYSMTIENGQFLYVANDGAANVAAFRIDATGSLKPIAGSPFAAGNHPQSIATN